MAVIICSSLHSTVHTVTHSIIYLLMYVAYDLWDTSVSYNLSDKFPTMEFCRSGNIFLRCKKNAKDCWKICIHFLTRYCSPFFLKLLGILNCLCTISFFNSVDCVDFTFIQFPCSWFFYFTCRFFVSQHSLVYFWVFHTI